MKIVIGEKEYSIKFGYKPTLKERILSKIIKFANITNNDDTNLEKIEDLLLFLPELLLVGLQVNHKDFRYNIDTGEGKEEQLEKAFVLVEEYFDNENGNILKFFGDLQGALMEDSFLSSLLRKEQKAAEIENMITTENNNEN